MALKILLEKLHHYPKLATLSVANGLKHRSYCFENLTKDDNDISASNFKCVNEVKLLGFVGQDPKQYLTISSQLTHFTMATNRYYVERGGSTQKVTTWHNIIVRAPYLQDYVLKYLMRGARVYVSGYIDSQPIACEDLSPLKGLLHVVAQGVIFLKRPYEARDENSAFFYGSRRSFNKGEN